MDTSFTICRVRQCLKCPGDSEYLCVSCPCDLCTDCKVNHIQDLRTIDHRVVSFHERCSPVQEISLKHPDYLYRKICKFCDRTDCFHCKEREKISLLSIRNTIEHTKERTSIHIMTNEALLYRGILMKGIKADIENCQKEFSLHQADMLTKAQRLKDLIGTVLRKFDFKHRCLNQWRDMKRCISSCEIYEQMHEQSAIRPVKFLMYKNTCLPEIHHTYHTSHLFMTESLDKKFLRDSLTEIKIREKGKRIIENEHLLKLMPGPELHQSVALPRSRGVFHMNSVTSNWFWASYNDNNIVLSNTAGDDLHRIMDTPSDLLSGYGAHTLNNSKELIYIDKEYNIKKLSMDLKRSTTFLTRAQLKLTPRCIYWSLSTNELLVATYKKHIRYIEFPEESEKFRDYTWTGKVVRFNESGQLTQTISHKDTGDELFKCPCKIIENNNGDVVVSDWSTAVVVTERGGRHRFSYTGHPSGSILQPRGICTDSLSHILVCDDNTETVQLLDKDGQFLRHLLIRPSGIIRPHNLNYDFSTHRLWVGSEDINKVLVYRYITRQDTLIDQSQSMSEVMETPNENLAQEAETLQGGNECLLKLMSSPELKHSFSVKGVYSCYHISFFKSDQVWVSGEMDINRVLANTPGSTIPELPDKFALKLNGLILANTTGNNEHQFVDIPIDTFSGLHTVNSEGELFYIDSDYNIKKLSSDMNAITVFIKQTDDPNWTPRSVYWSPSTGDLLVGMGKGNPEVGKVSRFNQSGQQSQIRQHDNSDLEIYQDPQIITENTNGNIVVSDLNAVVVTEREGRHRFSYTGHPPGSQLKPRGICTDAMSHILVCDVRSRTVQMLDENGQFLSHLLTKSQEMGQPSSLSYDATTHHLWLAAGSYKKYKVFVYKYMTLKDVPNDEDEDPQPPEGYPLSN